MGEKKAIVYSAEWCPWCHKAIDFLKELGVKVEVKDVGKDPELAKEVVEKSGQSGIPVILIKDEVIIGFNQPALKKALGIGEEKKEEKAAEEAKEETAPEEKKEGSDPEGKKEEEPKQKEEKKESDTSYV